MNGIALIATLAKAGIIPPDVTGVQLNAQANGHLSIHTEYIVEEDEGDLDRLRQIAQLAAKMVKLQLEDGQVDDRLAEQISELIRSG